MTENDKLQMFEEQTIRTAWDEEKEEWYFSVVDVVVALTESPDYKTGRKYWNKLKQRLKEEGNELVTNCHQLKMKSRRWQAPPYGCSEHRAVAAHHPVHPVQKGRAIQNVAGHGRA